MPFSCPATQRRFARVSKPAATTSRRTVPERATRCFPEPRISARLFFGAPTASPRRRSWIRASAAHGADARRHWRLPVARCAIGRGFAEVAHWAGACPSPASPASTTKPATELIGLAKADAVRRWRACQAQWLGLARRAEPSSSNRRHRLFRSAPAAVDAAVAMVAGAAVGSAVGASQKAASVCRPRADLLGQRRIIPAVASARAGAHEILPDHPAHAAGDGADVRALSPDLLGCRQDTSTTPCAPPPARTQARSGPACADGQRRGGPPRSSPPRECLAELTWDVVRPGFCMTGPRTRPSSRRSRRRGPLESEEITGRRFGCWPLFHSFQQAGGPVEAGGSLNDTKSGPPTFQRPWWP